MPDIKNFSYSEIDLSISKHEKKISGNNDKIKLLLEENIQLESELKSFRRQMSQKIFEEVRQKFLHSVDSFLANDKPSKSKSKKSSQKKSGEISPAITQNLSTEDKTNSANNFPAVQQKFYSSPAEKNFSTYSVAHKSPTEQAQQNNVILPPGMSKNEADDLTPTNFAI